MFFRKNSPICGERHDSYIEGYNEEIKSKDIISFSYNNGDYSFSAKKENNKVQISCSGGGKSNQRDGSLFKIRVETDDIGILTSLQDIIDRNNETQGNGHCIHVDGLPGGLGDTLEVEYQSGEKIYKTSNQTRTVSKSSIESFYTIFHESVKKEGFDFTTAGSNEKLFDDAEEEYLQGTWSGKHFGEEVEVTFNHNKVTIKINGKITDNEVEYTIYEGYVRKNELKEEVEDAKSAYDYKPFSSMEGFKKKNDFTLTGYFYNNASSTCDLFNFNKEKSELN